MKMDSLQPVEVTLVRLNESMSLGLITFLVYTSGRRNRVL
jgi:hypothetical protein